MMQYMLSVHHAPGDSVPSETEIAKMYADVEAVNQRIRDEGAWVFAGGLHPAETAAVVQHVDGEAVTTDGPFSSAREQIGGFWVIQVADRDAALAWATETSRACQGPVEVRPFQEEPEA